MLRHIVLMLCTANILSVTTNINEHCLSNYNKPITPESIIKQIRSSKGLRELLKLLETRDPTAKPYITPKEMKNY
jgi:hypothetical protein